jgi:hypothetical protein
LEGAARSRDDVLLAVDRRLDDVQAAVAVRTDVVPVLDVGFGGAPLV